MACKIEIRKTIDNSIAEELPYREAVMAKPAADKISKAINRLWGKISRVVQYSGIGGYKVIIPEQSIQEAVDKEYTKQEKAEAELMKDHEFFREPVQAPVEIEEEPLTPQEATQLTIPFEEEMPEVTDEISLYLATKMKEDLGVDIPIKNVDMYNLISIKTPITKEDIDNKKSEC